MKSLASLVELLFGRPGPRRPGADASAQAVGEYGEQVAADFLKKRGYRILQRNVSSRFGEIDILASHGGVLCFVEVKTRRDKSFGNGAAAVTPAKQRQIVRAAMDIARKRAMAGHDCRFDVVAVSIPEEGPPQVQVYPGAFEASGRY